MTTVDESTAPSGSVKDEKQDDTQIQSGDKEKDSTSSGLHNDNLMEENVVSEMERITQDEHLNVDDIPDVRQLIISRVKLSKLIPSMWQPDHLDLVDGFIDQSHQILCIYIDHLNSLKVEYSIPSSQVSEMTYFIKKDGLTDLNADSFFSDIQFGTVSGRHVESILRVMHGVYLPAIYRNTSWPDSIKNEFTAQLHKFMASLTDARWKQEGKTVLYIPYEGTVVSEEHSPGKINKELIQRLETTMIHWTRQIKEVLSSQDALQMSENAGPLEELEFWRNRCADLSGISNQLDKPGVKKITSVLVAAKSSYVAPFLKLSGQLKASSYQAQSNLKFLSVLKDPCHELSEAHPVEISPMLPKILNLVRMIWINSEFYNTRDRLTGILRKLSNEIIQRCCKEINLDRIFSGYVQSSVKTLSDCIACCENWKECYNKGAKLHHKFSPIPWVLDQSSIFAQVDAFIQRCKDLVEVCDCQRFFARKVEGDTTEIPHFGGQRGPEILRALTEIEQMFDRNLRILYGVKPTILDVKSTFWHDDYNRFRAGIKDLEVMMQNLIVSAFETVVTVEQGVEVLDVFMHLSARESIKRMIDKKTVDVYAMFNNTLNSVKKEMSLKHVTLPTDQPKFSGQARWSRMLKTSIERSMMALDRATFLPQIGQGEETRTQYQQLCQILDESTHKIFYEWTTTIHREPLKLLEIPLLRRSLEKSNMIDTNFEGALLKIFREVHYWERLSFEIPHYIIDIQARNDDLRIMRENVLLIVRDYNRVIATLTPEERGLFKERIRSLDKKIQPGLTKLLWSVKGMSEAFIGDCRFHASKVQGQVDSYKGSNQDISLVCKQISELLLVHIDPKKTYANMEFEEDQSTHRASVQLKLTQLHAGIISTMNQTYEVFKNDGAEVQQHWYRYTKKKKVPTATLR